ncbi:L-serine ammonia-lyase [Alkalispirochaeta americana]|uniref:L-serine dehydratase n=2 Tax=Alkalispirochaeta americana TaxID=159291 RepID=A0A1N6T405_9SPIO|nr:L-serine ammonia-lyase [Alkalispirochaeta americana]
MGPRSAAESFCLEGAPRERYRVTLYGSLAATGKGHMTDAAILDALGRERTELLWKPQVVLAQHPNGMTLEALSPQGDLLRTRTVFSIGGGAVVEDPGSAHEANPSVPVYPFLSMEEVLAMADQEGAQLWEYVDRHEESGIRDHLARVWQVMQEAIRRGLETEGPLPGGLRLPRKAAAYYARAQSAKGYLNVTGQLFAYALAVSEENAACSQIVTAPTCGSAGVLPAVLYYLKKQNRLSDERILNALATAGIIGNIVKQNASISGAEVGCQGEVGTACAMAAGAAAQLLGGTPHQIEYAAEMGMEHHLGLTCDPVAGLVQIPCIERNAIASVRALDCASYVLLSDGRHRITFDEVVQTMAQTGRDMNERYRETSQGGLSFFHGRCHAGGLRPRKEPSVEDSENPSEPSPGKGLD